MHEIIDMKMAGKILAKVSSRYCYEIYMRAANYEQ
jgi:hypothetical protein